MQGSTFVAVTPPLPADPALAIAACRAGALGVLDFEMIESVDVARASIERLRQFTEAPFGIRLASDQAAILNELLPVSQPQLEVVVVSGGNLASAPDIGRQLAKSSIQVWAETISIDEALEAAELGVDGIVLKGNESGGRVGNETSFVLIQRYCATAQDSSLANIPFWVQGGIGLNSAAAAAVAGAAGMVLDHQLLLTRESQLSVSRRRRLEACDGSETVEVGKRLGNPTRIWAGPQSEAVAQLDAQAAELAEADLSPLERSQQWRAALRDAMCTAGEDAVFPCGQDAALAAPLAERFVTVAGVLDAYRAAIRDNQRLACEKKPLAPGSSFAASHGIQYPLMQGPMTRVSDTPEFAKAVADAGGLPFLALALMRGSEAEKVVAAATEQLGDQPWGVGILGFLPAEIRQEQTEVILKYRPPAAIIAGGRPDQAKELEAAGIATYLHVPSPGLLQMFLRDGARRFIFEGRECGGHVGPRSSFVLWESMGKVLLEHLGPRASGDDLHVVFAGGIHDGLSTAMLSALAAPLAARNVKVGALMGTAYLFTQEAVETGAIVSRFQQEAIDARDTILFETGPGHVVRCVRTPYYDAFEEEKQRLQAAGHSHDEIVRRLEWMNVGRLRIASKGLDRASGEGNRQRKLTSVDETEQTRRGMYMIGQVAALRSDVTTMAELHEEVCTRGTARLNLPESKTADVVAPSSPCDIAIVGMAALFPDALGLKPYWENILARHDAVTEIPPARWDWRLYYDPDPTARDKIVSKWGGFLGDVPFDPFQYGITPKSIPAIEPLQLLVLEGVRHALQDAGYDRRPFDRENTSTVLGVGGGGSTLAVTYGLRSCLPMFDSVPNLGITSDEMLERIGQRFPEWTEDSFPGILLNVAAGRVANRFDFGGSNYALDAACASSLAAVHACTRELEMGTCNVALAIGADTVNTPYAYVAFSKTHALSQRGRCSPFDADADGIVLSEGVGVVVLKRLADAQRDGDRIYAVIKGMGASSDGMDKGLTAPNSSGQVRAIRRAFAKAQLSPGDVTLIEAHGTGTVVGDRTEATSLSQVMLEGNAAPQSCALGSVKSMIGHAKCAAGIAGLIKTVRALDRKTLPPTLVDTPNPHVHFSDSPLYLNTDARPWVHDPRRPRRAGVSAFGFGGTNVHAVLEEYQGDFVDQQLPAQAQWPAEVLIWQAESREALARQLESTAAALQAGAKPELSELAAALWKQRSSAKSVRAAIVATSLKTLPDRIASALQLIRNSEDHGADPRGVYFSSQPAAAAGKIALLFPGQGSQYPNMLAQVAMNFPQVRRTLDEAEAVLAGQLEKPLGRLIYPPSSFDESMEQQGRQELAATNVAQPAIGAASIALTRLLGEFGIKPDMAGGHSYGEFSALWAAGVFSDEQLLQLSYRRGELIRQATLKEGAGGMIAIDGDVETARALAADIPGLSLANINGPQQVVLSGTEEGLQQLADRTAEQKIRARRLPVACAFHSPLVADANAPLATELQTIEISAVGLPVFSNVTAEPYPKNVDEARQLLCRHLTSPVQFRDQVEAMYEAGARVFVEAGPGSVLTGLSTRILEDRPHAAVATDVASRGGLEQLAHALSQLFAVGADVQFDAWFRGREIAPLRLERLADATGQPEYSPSTWLVNGARSRPHAGPEPVLFGTRASSDPPPSSSPPPKDPASHTSVPSAAMPDPSPPASPPTTESGSDPVTGFSPPTTPQPAAGPSSLPLISPDAPPDESAEVMLGFQQVMSKFLETQQAVMLSYLNGVDGTVDPPSPANPANAIPSYAPAAQPAASEQPTASPAPQPAAPPVRASNPEESAAQNGRPVGNEVKPGGESISEGQSLNLEEIGDRLLDLFSERTGYPKEMLDIDLDLEADLGVDSIKRVEILGGLTESLNGDGTDLKDKLQLEQLTSRRSLRSILDYLADVLFRDDAAAIADSATSNGHPAAPDNSPSSAIPSEPATIQRGLVQLVETPLPAAAAPTFTKGAVVVTDDGTGVAQQIADRLADFGQTAVLISHQSGRATDANELAADLTSPAEVADLVKRLRTEFGPIGGLLHALPLAPLGEDDNLISRGRRDVKSIYLLARELEKDLRGCGEDGSAFLLAATALGGELGYGQRELSHPALAAHGGILGFLKCVGMEWPEVLVRSVDVDGRRDAADLSDCLLQELSDRDGPLEVGYRERTRVTWAPKAAPLDCSDEEARRPLEPGSTIVVTGGARGITAEIALALADRYSLNLIIVGRSAEPLDQEDPEIAELADASAIKQVLIQRFQASGTNGSPGEIESAYRKILRTRELRQNLARLRESGATVEYHCLDVRDRDGLARLIRDITDRYGRIDGVVHGAGVIEDKLLRDKTPESFDRVFGVKVDSVHALSELLDPDDLKFCIFFSSTASRYGNIGQSDYAAANEVVSKMALELDRRWPARVAAIAWGPWTDVGMVADLEPHFQARGVALIQPEIGAERFIEELEFGWKGESEVLIAGGADNVAKPPARGVAESKS